MVSRVKLLPGSVLCGHRKCGAFAALKHDGAVATWGHPDCIASSPQHKRLGYEPWCWQRLSWKTAMTFAKLHAQAGECSAALCFQQCIRCHHWSGSDPDAVSRQAKSYRNRERHGETVASTVADFMIVASTFVIIWFDRCSFHAVCHRNL